MKPVTIWPNFLTRKKGYALVSYLQYPSKDVYKRDFLSGHTNRWESREIVRILVSRGYVVDVIDWDNHSFIPTREYDIIIDIADLFSRWKKSISNKTLKILHLTGSYPDYQNNAERKAAAEFKQRTGVSYMLKRQIQNVDGVLESLALADAATLLGNEHTLQTYPQNLRSKISLLSVTASYLKFVKYDMYVPNKKHFLWYFGSGAIHKGLDKVVEVFLKREDITLHIVGNIDDDQSFWRVYQGKIDHAKNIIYHGFLQPDDPVFKSVVEEVFCFIAPSCSESMSTSVATCLCLGLYPIISRDTGITLSTDSGLYLEKASLSQVDTAITILLSYSNDRISKEIKSIQADAMIRYSRKTFSKNMRNFLISHNL